MNATPKDGNSEENNKFEVLVIDGPNSSSGLHLYSTVYRANIYFCFVFILRKNGASFLKSTVVGLVPETGNLMDTGVQFTNNIALPLYGPVHTRLIANLTENTLW